MNIYFPSSYKEMVGQTGLDKQNQSREKTEIKHPTNVAS